MKTVRGDLATHEHVGLNKHPGAGKLNHAGVKYKCGHIVQVYVLDVGLGFEIQDPCSLASG